jgi:DNA polymerase-3 subunit gamma/tau
MEHITLYRKWRPQNFEQVVGQRHVTGTLANALSGGRLVHAYLFGGPRGTGKTSTARILAKAINCVEGPTATPCNVCDACVSISEGTALDVIEIDAASNRKIDEIRDLLDKIPYAPTALRRKVYIIDEVHQLTTEASSALLKTLEEPPGHVVFVLATTEPHKILPTIVSRCQRFDFSLVSTPEISGLLGHIAAEESIDIEDGAIGMIAEQAHGSVRDAIGVMDQIANLEGEKVTLEQLAEMLGEVESELVFEMVNLITDRDTAGSLWLVGRMLDSGKDPRRFVESLISHLRSIFLVQNAANPREIVEATDEHFRRLEDQAKTLSRYEVVRLIERLGDTHREMRWSENPRIALECMLVKATRLDVDVTLEGLLYRIGELEKKMEAAGEVAIKPPEESTGARVEEAATAAPVSEKVKAGKRTAAKEREKVPAGKPEEPEERPAPERTAAGETTGKAEVKRAWMAVLAELKKQGHMKLYAVLMKVKVQAAAEGEVVLVFPEDASFQQELLKGSGELSRVEEMLAGFTGKPVRLKIKQSGRRKEGGSGPRSEKAGGSEKLGEQGVKSAIRAEAGEKKAASSDEAAKILLDKFGGEIIENKDKGKE